MKLKKIWSSYMKPLLQNLRYLKIRQKLLLLVAVTSLVPVIVIGILSISTISSEVQAEVVQGNVLYAMMTRDRIQSFFHNREGDARILAESNTIRGGISTLNTLEQT